MHNVHVPLFFLLGCLAYLYPEVSQALILGWLCVVINRLT